MLAQTFKYSYSTLFYTCPRCYPFKIMWQMEDSPKDYNEIIIVNLSVFDFLYIWPVFCNLANTPVLCVLVYNKLAIHAKNFLLGANEQNIANFRHCFSQWQVVNETFGWCNAFLVFCIMHGGSCAHSMLINQVRTQTTTLGKFLMLFQIVVTQACIRRHLSKHYIASHFIQVAVQWHLSWTIIACST